ncbi:hypothetical protein ACWEKT_18165 [Nocardia takedensis]
MGSPLEQSIVDMLRQSALGAVIDRPVDDVLREMGLPGLPQLPPMPPLPQLPPLPPLDLTALAKPITELASSFGSGKLGGGPGIDPIQVLTQVTTVLQTVSQLSSTAMQAVAPLWQGAGATAANAKAATTAADTAAVSGQGARMTVGSTSAAGSVFTGNVLMTGVTAKFLASLAAAGPFLGTPAGQAFLVAMTAQTLSEALAIVAKTRAELTAHSAAMARNGEKVPVTDAPKGVPGTAEKVLSMGKTPVRQVASAAQSPLSAAKTLGSPAGATDPSSYVSQALQLVQSLVQIGSTGAQVAAQVAAPHLDAAPVAGLPIAAPTPLLGGVSAVAGGGAASVGAAPAQPIPLQEARTMTVATGGPAGVTPGGVTTAAAGGLASNPGMMPMAPGAAGAAAATRAAGADGVLRTDLVTAEHGNAVVGPLAGVSVPVVGAAETVTATPDIDPESPDKALTL